MSFCIWLYLCPFQNQLSWINNAVCKAIQLNFNMANFDKKDFMKSTTNHAAKVLTKTNSLQSLSTNLSLRILVIILICILINDHSSNSSKISKLQWTPKETEQLIGVEWKGMRPHCDWMNANKVSLGYICLEVNWVRV